MSDIDTIREAVTDLKELLYGTYSEGSLTDQYIKRIETALEAQHSPSPAEPEQTRVWDEIVDKLELKDHIKACCDLTMMGVLTDVGLREDKSWGPDEEPLLGKLMEVSRIQCEWILGLIAAEAMSATAPSTEPRLTVEQAMEVVGGWLLRSKYISHAKPIDNIEDLRARLTKAATGN